MEGVPLEDLIKWNKNIAMPTSEAPRQPQGRVDTHQNTQDLLSQLEAFKEKKESLKNAPQIVSHARLNPEAGFLFVAI